MNHYSPRDGREIGREKKFAKYHTEDNCKYCGEIYYPKRKWQKFCTDTCRMNYHRERYFEMVRKYREDNGEV